MMSTDPTSAHDRRKQDKKKKLTDGHRRSKKPTHRSWYRWTTTHVPSSCSPSPSPRSLTPALLPSVTSRTQSALLVFPEREREGEGHHVSMSCIESDSSQHKPLGRFDRPPAPYGTDLISTTSPKRSRTALALSSLRRCSR